MENKNIPDIVSIDAGKGFVKGSVLLANGEVNQGRIKSKYSEGSFDDNHLGKGTCIVQIDDGPVYKFGASGMKNPEMETSKLSICHKIGFYALIALMLTEGEHDVCAGFSIPYSEITSPDIVNQYLDYIYEKPGITHTVRIKRNNYDAIKTVNIKFTGAYIFPESAGAAKVYSDDPQVQQICGIIDLGHRNAQFVYLLNCENPQADKSLTSESGGAHLLNCLTRDLQRAQVGRVDENVLLHALIQKPEERYLIPNNRDKEIMKKSKACLDKGILSYVTDTLKMNCDSLEWPIEYMKLIAIGGTTTLISPELKQVFGEHIIIPEDAEYTNANGNLLHMATFFRIKHKELRNKLVDFYKVQKEKKGSRKKPEGNK